MTFTIGLRLRRLAVPVLAAALWAISAVASAAGPIHRSHGEHAVERGGERSGVIVGYVPGRILVQARAGLEDRDLDEIVGRHGGKRRGHLKAGNVHIVELAQHGNEMAVLRMLRRNRNLKFAELDMIVAPALVPNDPNYSTQWHLPKISADRAWDFAQGDGVTIAVLDTGVDGTHPDLAPLMVPGWNFYDNNADTSDVQGHGTNVAGAAAAAGNNAIGVSGVTWRARIMPIRIADPQAYATFSRMAAGVIFAADNGARVANISYSGASGSLTVQNAANYMRSKGGVVVISGENSGTLLTHAASASVTCVSATNTNDVRPSWSSWGAHIDVAAPGVGIRTTARGGGYSAPSGTSFSAPITAGVYALMMSANPDLAPATLDSILFSTAQDIGDAGFDQYYGYGRINAASAVEMARNTGMRDTQAPFVSIVAPAGGTVAGNVAVDVSAVDNVAVTRVELYANGNLVATDDAAPYAFSWNSTTLPDGAANLQAKAYDAAGNVASSEVVAVAIANDVEAPIVSVTNPTDGSTVSGTVYVTASAYDNNAVSHLSLAIDGVVVASSSSGVLTYAWAGTAGRGRTKTTLIGSFTLTATAEDMSGNRSSQSVTVMRR